ncbi:1104_t:CDS:2, partial [Scutellospora calospora]
ITDDRNQETLKRIIKKHVKRNSIIHTDSWKGYYHLESLGYIHKRVNHSRKRLQGRIHSNSIEG